MGWREDAKRAADEERKRIEQQEQERADRAFKENCCWVRIHIIAWCVKMGVKPPDDPEPSYGFGPAWDEGDAPIVFSIGYQWMDGDILFSASASDVERRHIGVGMYTKLNKDGLYKNFFFISTKEELGRNLQKFEANKPPPPLPWYKKMF